MHQQDEGFNRVGRLVDLAGLINTPVARNLLGSAPGEDASQDILRAAVVLIHAHLEEFLRTISRVLLPEGNEACLNEIPLCRAERKTGEIYTRKARATQGKSLWTTFSGSRSINTSKDQTTTAPKKSPTCLRAWIPRLQARRALSQQFSRSSTDATKSCIAQTDSNPPCPRSSIRSKRETFRDRSLRRTSLMQSFDFPLLQKLIVLQHKTASTTRSAQPSTPFAHRP